MYIPNQEKQKRNHFQLSKQELYLEPIHLGERLYVAFSSNSYLLHEM
jgi:hypothetical protein